MKRDYEKYLAWKKRSKPIKKRKRKSRVGKLGIVRLEGAEKEMLRLQAFNRSGGVCEFEGCGERITWENSEMAHVQGSGAGGSDVIENVKMSCKWRLDRMPGCHIRSHNSGGKPCPRKPAAVTEEVSGE